MIIFSLKKGARIHFAKCARANDMLRPLSSLGAAIIAVYKIHTVAYFRAPCINTAHPVIIAAHRARRKMLMFAHTTPDPFIFDCQEQTPYYAIMNYEL